ncbi:hypothetical protein LOD99_198 [Oopsacas minuta]|uniref:Uncharacterized protein n=1 Tax=Oopsacas minuta TaxID=111878 RepID=A0AAV7K897_9METZ|nr:hypothetical protein LOD99_198 [Oopsacas minuta]
MASNSEDNYLDLLALAAQTKDPYFLIQGHSSTGKTSILFHQAILTCQNKSEVLFISPTAPTKLPALPPDSTPKHEHLKFIQLKYPATQSDLIQLLAAVHESNLKPSLVLLDCLEVYARGEGGDTDVIKLAKILALLRDATNFWSIQTDNKNIPIFICSEIYYSVVSKWIPHKITIEREDGKSFKLIVSTPTKAECRYSLKDDQFIRLRGASELNED